MEKKNVPPNIYAQAFEGARMGYIQLPLSAPTMKHLRRRFITYVVEELEDI